MRWGCLGVLTAFEFDGQVGCVENFCFILQLDGTDVVTACAIPVLIEMMSNCFDPAFVKLLVTHVAKCLCPLLGDACSRGKGFPAKRDIIDGREPVL